MRNVLLLLGMLLSSLFYGQNVFSADSLKSEEWRPVRRSVITPTVIIDGHIMQFHFETPAENNTIQIYDQSGQLIFEDCFSTLSSPDYQISLEDFSVGCYTVYYSDSNGQMSGFLTIDE